MNDSAKMILVVDDEPDMRDVICSDLQDRGLKTFEASDGQSALKILRREDIAVVLSDLSMPSLEGMALLAQMRQEDLWQPFIILTGYGSKEASVTALRLGAFDFLEKPVDFERLAAIVKEALTAHDAHKEMVAVLTSRVGSPQDPSAQRKIDSLARMFAARSSLGRKAD